MQNPYSPLTHNLAQIGLHNLLFSSEEQRNAYSYALRDLNQNPKKNNQISKQDIVKQQQNNNKVIQKPSLPRPTQQNNLQNQVLTFSKWPKNWLEIHQKFGLPKGKNSMTKIAWTYEGLEQDVMGEANLERQKAVRQLLLDLNHQKGTHIFIPYSFTDLEQSQLEIVTIDQMEYSFFWSAMNLIEPRILLIFGSAARNAIQAPKSLPLQKSQLGKLQVLQMHRFETLANDQTFYNNTLVFLQSYLQFCRKK